MYYFQHKKTLHSMKTTALLLFLAAMALVCANASAHTLGEGYLFINVSDEALAGRYEITLTDLDKAVPIDTNQDGKVVEAEVDAAIDRIKAYFGERIGLGNGTSEYPMRFVSHKLTRIPVGQFLELH